MLRESDRELPAAETESRLRAARDKNPGSPKIKSGPALGVSQFAILPSQASIGHAIWRLDTENLGFRTPDLSRGSSWANVYAARNG